MVVRLPDHSSARSADAAGITQMREHRRVGVLGEGAGGNVGTEAFECCGHRAGAPRRPLHNRLFSPAVSPRLNLGLPQVRVAVHAHDPVAGAQLFDRGGNLGARDLAVEQCRVPHRGRPVRKRRREGVHSVLGQPPGTYRGPVVVLGAVEPERHHGTVRHRDVCGDLRPRRGIKIGVGRGDDAVAVEAFGLRRVALHQLGGLSLDRINVDPRGVAVVVAVNPAPFALVLVRQACGRRVPEPEHVRRRRLHRAPCHRILGRVGAVRRLQRPAAHTGYAAALRLGHPDHLVRFDPQPGLVLHDERHRVTQARVRGRRHGVDSVKVRVTEPAKDANEILPRRHQLLQRTQSDHCGQRPPSVVHLVLRHGSQLDQRRRMPTAHRLTSKVTVPEPAPTPVIGAFVDVARLRPATKLRRTHSLHTCQRGRVRTLARLLCPDNLTTTVDERLIQRRTLHVVLHIGTNPVMVRRHPKLLIRQAERAAPLPHVRHHTVGGDPSVDQVAECGKVDSPIRRWHCRPRADDA